MARLTAVEADYKRLQGKELFTKGFSIANISEMIGISVKTLGKWREEGKWDDEKELQTLKPSSIRKLTRRLLSGVNPCPIRRTILLKLLPPLTVLLTIIK